MRVSKLLVGSVAIAVSAVAASGLARHARSAYMRHPVSGKSIMVPGLTADGTILFNGWKISPAGRLVSINDMPEGGAFSPDGSLLAICNCGYNAHKLNIIDVKSETLVASIPVSRLGRGVAWSPDGSTIYAAGGIENPNYDIYRFRKGADGNWGEDHGAKLALEPKAKRRISDIALSKNGATLYALNQYDGNCYAVSTTEGKTLGSVKAGDHPEACLLNSSGDSLFVASLGGSEVVSLKLNAGQMNVASRYPTGSHPNSLALGKDGLLYVSCANSDHVCIIDIVKGTCIESVRTSTTAHSPAGATPEAVALSHDGSRLYVADADDNDVCVIDVSKRAHSRVIGYIPTGWYPTAVLVSPDDKHVLIGSGKGTGTGPNQVKLPIPDNTPGNFQHHGHQLNGSISFVDLPDTAKLADYTRHVIANSPYNDTQLKASAGGHDSIIPEKVGATCPITHVLYIIRENRTYDQVFGDEPKGNGDSKLCLFGRDVTPNGHQLAEKFALLDNLYCSGEVSQDGHPWCVSASCTDFTERSWVQSYSGHGDTEGGNSVEDPAAGFIWQACKKKGLSVRCYGEYADHPSLAADLCGEFIGKGKPGSAPPGRDMDKADIFLADLRVLESQHKTPNFMIMSLGEDHTSGTSPGAHTPKAMVGSNDQALGKIVEGISHDKELWKHFAIFVIEDDAQNGPDHIDSHRTEGLVISPYVKRGVVDSTMYSTASMLRTIELIFGLKPLTRYDASANPMYASFGTVCDDSPYSCLPPRTDLAAVNQPSDYGARKSAKMDFRGYDRNDPDELNDILWHSIKGASVPVPAPTRSSFVANSITGKEHEGAKSTVKDD